LFRIVRAVFFNSGSTTPANLFDGYRGDAVQFLRLTLICRAGVHRTNQPATPSS
jgi:hypothetical protein